MTSCSDNPHYHLFIRLLDCSSGKEVYVGTLQTDALYAYNIDNSYRASTIKDLITIWKDRRCILDNDAVASVEWNDETLDPEMLIRDVCVDNKKIPLYIPDPNNPIILKYWTMQ
uniref:Uncharacterized protein n=1 Tax=viral metagenome TaxID=1070528 RepID=A0A6C0HIX5_9ZZZZ